MNILTYFTKQRDCIPRYPGNTCTFFVMPFAWEHETRTRTAGRGKNDMENMATEKGEARELRAVADDDKCRRGG